MAIHWWDLVMSSRLNDMEHGARVIIMQRLHEDDLSGHVLAQGGYEHLCLPSEFDPKHRALSLVEPFCELGTSRLDRLHYELAQLARQARARRPAEVAPKAETRQTGEG